MAKLADARTTFEVLAGVWGLTGVIADAAYGLLLSLELCLGLAAMLLRSHLALTGVCLLLTAVSVSPLLQIVLGIDGNCGCGLSNPWIPDNLKPWFAIGTNIAFVGIALPSLAFSHGRST